MNYNHTFERPAEIELIRQMARGTLKPKQEQQLNNWLAGEPDSKDAFIIKPAAAFLQHTDLNCHSGAMLFGDFWYEGELCILFADTNVGKSILAVQIGDALSRGIPIPRFAMRPQPGTVLYFDFELSDAQFAKRYTSELHGMHEFHPNFYRVVSSPDATGARRFASYHEYINNALENAVTNSQAQVVIIDNITCLRSGTQAAATAVSLCSICNRSKSDTGYRYWYWPIRLNETRHARLPATTCRAAKCSSTLPTAHLLLAKARPNLTYATLNKLNSAAATRYGAGNVYLCEIIKPYNNLHFDFYGPAAEADHLIPFTEQHRKTLENRILTLHQQGRSIRPDS